MARFWPGRRVLVTGGAGFLGSHVVERLVAEGAEVTVPVRSEPSYRLEAVLDGLRLLRGDLEEPAFCERCVEGQQVLVHLAADFGGALYLARDPLFLLGANVRPFFHLAGAAVGAGVERLLLASSAAARTATDAYGQAKRFQEDVARACADQGMAVAVVRLFNCYGPRDELRPERARVIPSLLARVLSGEDPVDVWGDGTARRSFLYADDAARGLLMAAAAAPGPEPLDLGSSEEVSVAELAGLVLEACGSRAALRFDPAKPGGGPRPPCDPAAARDRLGFVPAISLREGLRRTAEWMRGSKDLPR